MANRALLASHLLPDFRTWLEQDGWAIEATHEEYKVLQARKPGRKHPLMVYEHDGDREHLSVHDRDEGAVRAFIRWRKQQ